MSLWLVSVAACVAGFSAGLGYFAGLHWTIGKALASTRPARWILASFAARLTLLVAVLGPAAQGHGERLLAACAGIMLARAFLSARARRAAVGA